MDFDSSSSENRSPRHGRARERVRKRQERATAEHSAVKPPRQLTPSGGFKLPTLPFPMPQPRVLALGAGAVVLVVIVLLLMSRLTGASTAPTAPPNALWLGTEWTYALDESAHVPDLVQRLREHHIGTVYAWMSWLKDDMVWGGRKDGRNEFSEVEDTVKLFVADFNKEYPEATLYAWISLPVGTDRHSMDDAAVQQALIDFSKRALNEFGFEGIFLNIEPVWNNDSAFLRLLTNVRQALGEDVLISAAIPPDWSPTNPNIPVPPMIAPGTVWDEHYKQSVALLVDELAVMAYNSGLSDPDDYTLWVAYQVKAYADAVAALDTGTGAGTQVMIGIPTYAAEPPGHDPLVENIASALQGVRLGLQQAGDNAQYVRGVAIYADWETDETEWSQFMVNWIESS